MMRAVALLLLLGCGENVGPLLDRRDPPPAGCTDTGMISCGVGACLRSVPACNGGVANVCIAAVPQSEICNDVDDDCDGTTDDGCDDDRDGFCDEAVAFVGRPKVCPLSDPELLDCDDTRATRNPGQSELCDDAIDNDCNGFVDYLDIDQCTPVSGSFQDADGAISLLHGSTQVIRASVSPPHMYLSRSWVVTGALPYTTCSLSDVTISRPEEQPGLTSRTVGIVDDPTKLSCRYEITLYLADVPTDRLALTMRNPRPRVSQVVGASSDNDVLTMRVAAGTAPRLTAIVPADDDAPVVVEWVGQHASLLDCTAPCVGDVVQFRQPLPQGTYRLRLRSRDAFDGVNRFRDLVIEAVDCVWARATGTGAGTGPSLAQAYGNIEAAVGAASASGAEVCIAGNGTFNLGTTLTLPAGVGLNAAFDGTGMPSGVRPLLSFAPNAHLSFAPDYAATIRRVRLRSAGARLVEVTNASPTLFGVQMTISGAAGARAIELTSEGALPSVLRVVSSQIRADVPLDGATGIEVKGDSVAELIWTGPSTIDLLSCSGLCRGIALSGNGRASLSGQRIDVEAVGAGSSAVGVELRGTEAQAATAEIRLVKQLLARTRADQPADRTVSIALSHTEGVHIIGNDVIGPTIANSGARFSAAIADGEIRRDGSIERGSSSNLTIASNRQIAAGRADHAWSCSEGTDVGAGIVLVGTSSATVRSNGNSASRDNAIFGAASSAVWDRAERAIPPSVPAIWTVETTRVRIDHNEIRAGVLSAPAGCPIVELPQVVAVRDGLGPWMSPSLASEELALDGNGIVTGRRASFDSVPRIDRVGARLVELSGGSAKLVNNYLAVTRGTDLVALQVYGARDVEVWNNVLELEAITSTGAVVSKRALVVDDAESIDLVNNIMVIWHDAGDAPSPIAIEELSERSIASLRHNLLFVEAAERQTEGGYVRSGGRTFTRQTFPQYEAEIDGANNLILPPLFRARRAEHWRSLTRLSPRSPARDKGQSQGAPALDRFGRPRPLGSGVDIGIEEYSP